MQAVRKRSIRQLAIFDIRDKHRTRPVRDADRRPYLFHGNLRRDTAGPEYRKLIFVDLVTFVLGCSYSFELPLIEEGISIQHLDRNKAVPMYRTNIACTPAGPFVSNMVVSMRPLAPGDAIRAIQITSQERM